MNLKRKILIISLLFIFIIKIYPTNIQKYKKVWPNLKTIDFGWHGVLAYDQSKIIELPNNDDRVVCKFYLKNKNNIYVIEKSKPGGLLPPFSMLVVKKNDEKESIVSAKFICISGSGLLYIEKPLGNNGMTGYKITQKWIEQNNTIIQINQPFYYIGVNCLTNENIKIYKEKNENYLIANIKKGSNIEIIATSGVTGLTSDWYLVKSVTGLIGWHKPFYIDREIDIDKFSISILDGNYP